MLALALVPLVFVVVYAVDTGWDEAWRLLVRPRVGELVQLSFGTCEGLFSVFHLFLLIFLSGLCSLVIHDVTCTLAIMKTPCKLCFLLKPKRALDTAILFSGSSALISPHRYHSEFMFSRLSHVM